MNQYFDNSNNLLLDFEPLFIEALPLKPKQIAQAVELSNQILYQEKQWQTYLHALAFFSFESWLHSRIPEIPINSSKCSIWRPSHINIINGIFNLEVGQFKVCLLATGSMDDDIISIPRAVVDLPEYIAHFYVLVNVQEEQEEAMVKAFISYDKLLEHKQSVNLQPKQDWTYELSGDWFNQEPDNLLLYLRCLEPTAIALPSLNRLTNVRNIQAQLQSLIPQLQSWETPLWKILDWQTAIPLLTNSELLDWLYQVQTERTSVTQKVVTLTKQLVDTGKRLTEEVINVGLWLQNELDEFSENLAWNLLPSPTFAMSSMRFLPVNKKESPTEEMEMIIAQLRNSGMDIPVEVGGAYRDFSLGINPLRLYGVTWAIEEQEDSPEWTLLVVLGSQSEHQLPQDLRLQLKENNILLDEKIVEQNSDDTYLYTRVIGAWDEKFSVTIILANGETLVLPPFGFVREK